LIQGSVEAARSALKRLEGDGARLVLVIESSARHRALGSAAADEWAAIKSEVDSRTPCVGWLCDHVAGYGRGVRPVDAHGSLVVRSQQHAKPFDVRLALEMTAVSQRAKHPRALDPVGHRARDVSRYRHQHEPGGGVL